MKLLLLLLLGFSTSTQANNVQLDTIEVQESSALESEFLSPVPMNVITQEEIKEQGGMRLQDVLYYEQGVSLMRSGTKLAPSIRGLNPEHTLFLINGQRLANEPTNRYDLERLDLTNIERIEIIKGPLSTIYGADALGGVINLVTKRIQKDKVSVNLRNSSYDFKSPRNSVSAQVDKKLGAFGLGVFGTHMNEDPLFYNKRETIDDSKEINSYGLILEYKKGPLEFRGRRTWSEDHHKSLYYNFLNSSYVYDDDQHKRQLTSGELIYDEGFIKHVTSATFTSYKKNGDTHLQNNDNLLMSKRARIYVTEIKHRSEFSLEEHQFTAGVGHRREDFYGNAFNYQNRSRYLPEFNSFYVLDQWAATERLLIVPSLRYENINYFEDKILGQLGATLFLDERMEKNIKFNFAQGYRVPTPKDLYVDVMIMKGNPNLVPETTNSYNLDFNFLSRDTSLRAGIFYTDINNLIEEHFDDGLGKHTFRNVSGARVAGTEVYARKRFSHHENGIGHTYLDARSEEDRLASRPRHQFLINTTIFFRAFNFTNDITCRSEELLYDEDNKLREESYCSVDAGFIFQRPKYQLLLKGMNLLNDFKRGGPQRPRSLTVALNTQF